MSIVHEVAQVVTSGPSGPVSDRMAIVSKNYHLSKILGAYFYATREK